MDSIVKRVAGLLHTSIGQKLAVAVSGLALGGFLIVHMLGNLTIYQGPEVMNAYAAWLQGHPLLWLVRVLLLGAFVVHTSLALRLALINRLARPVSYTHRRENLESTFLSRYVVLTGLLVLSFVIFHLLHFTLGTIQPAFAKLVDVQGHRDVYAMVVRSFQVPAVSVAYLAAMAVLGLHLAHGLVSLFQTFGLYHETYVGLNKLICYAIAGLIVAANSSIPIAVWLGFITP